MQFSPWQDCKYQIEIVQYVMIFFRIMNTPQVGMQAYLLWEKAGKPEGADFSKDARKTLQEQIGRGATIVHLEKSLKAPSPKEPEPMPESEPVSEPEPVLEDGPEEAPAQEPTAEQPADSPEVSGPVFSIMTASSSSTESRAKK